MVRKEVKATRKPPTQNSCQREGRRMDAGRTNRERESERERERESERARERKREREIHTCIYGGNLG